MRLIESRTFAYEDRLAGRLLPFLIDYRIAELADYVEVPAGRYADCVRVEARGARRVLVNRGREVADVDIVHTDWYAPMASK